MAQARIIGYVINGNSCNGADFFDGTAPDGTLCPDCGSCLDLGFAPAMLAMQPSRHYDISYTHDLRTLFSQRMVDVLQGELGIDEAFQPIRTPLATLYYCLPRRVLPFDAVRRQVRFEGACTRCGGHASVAGAHPAFFAIESLPGPGLFRSDLCFASGRSKQPMLVVDEASARALKAQRFRGLDLEPAYCSFDFDPAT